MRRPRWADIMWQLFFISPASENKNMQIRQNLIKYSDFQTFLKQKSDCWMKSGSNFWFRFVAKSESKIFTERLQDVLIRKHCPQIYVKKMMFKVTNCFMNRAVNEKQTVYRHDVNLDSLEEVMSQLLRWRLWVKNVESKTDYSWSKNETLPDTMPHWITHIQTVIFRIVSFLKRWL